MRTSDIGHGRLTGPLASVRPDRSDWHVAHVPLVDLSDLHWDRPETGSKRSDGPTLCAFTSCDCIVAGELPHPGGDHAHPHAVRVCIFREDNDRAIFDRLRLEAGPPPRTLDELRMQAEG
jgi:hypothetical protein